MRRFFQAAMTTLLTVGTFTVVTSPAQAVTNAADDPIGDTIAGSTYDIFQLGGELTTSTVKVTVKTAGALPQLSDPSWKINGDTGRSLQVYLGAELDHPYFLVTADGLSINSPAGRVCTDPPTVEISNNSVSVSAPAHCFNNPGTLKLSARMAKGLDPSPSNLDFAIAPQVVTLRDKPATVDMSLPGGYYQLGRDGGVFAFGDAKFYGSTGNLKLNKPVVGMDAIPNNAGYRFVASDGGVFAYGDAMFYGSMGGQPLNKPIVAMVNTPSGNGYWLVASDGGVFAYGDAKFHGSTGSIKLNKPIVDIATTPTGNGYWLVASDGGVFAFGDATFYGSASTIPNRSEIVGITANLDGSGYHLVARDNGGYAFGKPAGSSPSITNNVAADKTSDNGTYLANEFGAVRNSGDHLDFGDVQRLRLVLNQPIIGFAVRK